MEKRTCKVEIVRVRPKFHTIPDERAASVRYVGRRSRFDGGLLDGFGLDRSELGLLLLPEFSVFLIRVRLRVVAHSSVSGRLADRPTRIPCCQDVRHFRRELN